MKNTTLYYFLIVLNYLTYKLKKNPSIRNKYKAAAVELFACLKWCTSLLPDYMNSKVLLVFQENQSKCSFSVYKVLVTRAGLKCATLWIRQLLFSFWKAIYAEEKKKSQLSTVMENSTL